MLSLQKFYKGTENFLVIKSCNTQKRLKIFSWADFFLGRIKILEQARMVIKSVSRTPVGNFSR